MDFLVAIVTVMASMNNSLILKENTSLLCKYSCLQCNASYINVLFIINGL